MRKSPVSLNETYELTITSLTSEGEGVGRISGFAIFVDGALPGEIVEAKIIEVKKRFARASLSTVLHRSSHRVVPPCKFFGSCGGCQLMHLSYSEQLEMKRKRVEEALRRIGHLEDMVIHECTPSPQEYHYRNKVTMPVGYVNGSKIIGFYKCKSHLVIDIDNCEIQSILGNKILNEIRESIKHSDINVQNVVIKTAVQTQQALVILVSSQKNSKSIVDFAINLMERYPNIQGVLQNTPPAYGKGVFGKHWMTLVGKEHIEENLCGLTFKISGASFFQVNALQAQQLYETVIRLTGMTKESVVLDAYCGVGTLALITAKYAKHVYGIEIVPEAIQDANSNAVKNGITNCTFTCGLAEALIPKYREANIVLLNPPRQGCEKKVLETLLSSHPQKIVYVSCDPTSLARDLSILSEGYSIETIQPFDMFPQTAHVETVVSLNPKIAHDKADLFRN